MNELRDNFEKIVLKVTNKNFAQHNDAVKNGGHAVKCEDQFVATIEITNSKVCFIDNDIETNDRKGRQTWYKLQNVDTIALILESPHSEEFNNDEYIGPAMGKTGDGIKNMLLGNLAKFKLVNDLQNNGSYFKTSSEISEGIYKLLIINAIQYQCSLGNRLNNDSSTQQRDQIFENFFQQEAREDFVRRLNFFNPKIIINCCTGGHYGQVDGLQKQVQEVIDSFNFSALKLIGSHPASPFFARGFCKV